jgi:CHAT domain-containing protein
VLCRGLGDYAGAAAAYQEAEAACARHYGHDATERLEILNRQCEVLCKQKRFIEAAAVGRQAMHLALKTRGPTHRDTADALHYLGLALADLDDPREAEAVLQRVLEIRRKTDGEAGYWTGLEWNNLGTFHLQHGRLEEARTGIQNGASILGRHISQKSPDAIGVQRNLIRLAIEGGQGAEAARRAERLFALELGLFRESFADLDENGRLDMKAQFEPGRWFATLGDAPPIARALLQTKAITIDQMIAAPPLRANDRDPFAHLLRPENAAQGLLPDGPRSATAPAKTVQARGPNQTESRDRTPPGLPGNALYSVTPAQVCRALPAHTIAIEFTRYKHYVGRFKDEARYGALVFLPAGAEGDPLASLRWVPLGAAEPIDREIDRLLNDSTQPLAALKFAGRLKALHALVWDPIARVLPPGVKDVYLSPDGQLCFLPFAGLLDTDGVFLADRHLVMYVSTVRDLFRSDAVDRIRPERLSIFAAPEFGGRLAGTDTLTLPRFRDADARSLARLQLIDLPGTQREAEALARLAQDRRIQPRVFTGSAANKANVRQVERPHIVHFATHGFMLPPANLVAPSNPMDRSGLALAGAQATLQALAGGGTPPASEVDGLLTARQVAQLPWRGTWLVTLSACDTGRGEARDGESVLGLRRGFLAAGVENLLLSLWRISDDDTVEFMRAFYTRALDSVDAATALAHTQREWLTRRRQERGIAAAVSIAGAFVLNTSGRLSLPPTTENPAGSAPEISRKK